MRHSAQTLSKTSKRPLVMGAVMAFALAACAGSDPDFTGADGIAEATSESIAVVALTWRTTDGNRYAATNMAPTTGSTGRGAGAGATHGRGGGSTTGGVPTRARPSGVIS